MVYTNHWYIWYILYVHAGISPRSLPTHACTKVPRLGLESIGKTNSLPEEKTITASKEIKKVTSIHRVTSQNDKVFFLILSKNI